MTSSLEDLIREAASADSGARQTRAAARLMTLLEKDPQRLPELFQHHPADAWPQPRLVLGVTGAPGSGKSSLTDALVRALRAQHPEARVGVIAVDPSSPFTGGAVLGDRVRMMRHATDTKVFIRSLATRGHLGGLSLGVKGVLRVMGLIGCESVIIETVGVGQSEVEVARVADLVAIVLAPGQGDSVQLLKAGLMEVGDLFVVNKADRDGASQLYSALLATLSLENGNDRPSAVSHAGHRTERPDVFLVSATEERGMPELVDYLLALANERHEAWMHERRNGITSEVEEAVLEEVRRRISAETSTEDWETVLRGDKTVAALATELMNRGARNEAR